MAVRVNPTRMELTRLKKRLRTAVRGHKLLKDKRDEMARRFVELVKVNRRLRARCEDRLAAAMGRFAAARAEMGNAAVTEALIYPVRSSSVETGTRNILNIEAPTIKLKESGGAFDLPYSFAFTSGELDGAVLDLAALLPQLVELAEIEKTCSMLADELEKTRRRVNALEHVLIPEMERTIKHIAMKLEENERGTITRLMKVKEMLSEGKSL